MKHFPKPKTTPFKVAAVSSNMNSFGLTGMILLGLDGEAWEVGASSLHLKKVGDVLRVPGRRSCRNFARLGFEIPRPLPQAPAGVVAEVWHS